MYSNFDYLNKYNIVTELAHLPEMCIFGLINNETKTLLIFRTTNIVTSLSRILKDYKYSNLNIVTDFKLIIIENIKDKNNLWVRYNFYISHYSNAGYAIHNRCKYNIRYKLRKQILADFRMKSNVRALFYVKVVSRRYKEVIVGIFDKVEDMDSFTDTFYPDGLINNITYSSNHLTKEYYAK